MGSLLIRIIEKLRVSLWIIPGGMSLIAAVCAYGLVLAERHTVLGDTVPEFLRAGGAEGVSELLATVAGSMITVAGVSFSITVVGLTLASQQFGPRILRNFMTDRHSQVIMGCFVSTFLYCIVVLWAVRGTDDTEFVPHYAAAFAILLTIVSIGMLIWFFHHFASSIVVERVLSNVGHELQWSIRHAYPSGGADAAAPAGDPFAQATLVTAAGEGYVLDVAMDALLKITSTRDFVVEVLAGPGSFVYPGHPLLRLAGQQNLSSDVSDDLRDCFPLGTHRTPSQDVEFGISQLVEVGLRALSPSLNDPNTAIASIDRLAAGLTVLAVREDPTPWRADAAAIPRVLTHALTWHECVELAFLRLIAAGRGIPAIPTHMLRTIAGLLRVVPLDRQASLVKVAAEIRRQGAESVSSPLDRERIEAAWGELERARNQAFNAAPRDRLAV